VPAAYCLLPVVSFAQSPTAQTFADKNDILIGEQVKIKVKTIFPLHSAAINYSLIIPDSIPHFDIVNISKADTVNYKDDSKAIEQTLSLTSFDSGHWVIPSLQIKFEQPDQQHFYTLQTDSFPINVSYSPPDSTNQLRDIKPIMEVTVTDYTWYYIAGGILLLLIIGYLLWRYLAKRKRNPADISNNKLSAYEEAMAELDKLAQCDLQMPEGIKIFHTKLSDIFKRYLGRKQNKNLANSTTGDLLINLAGNNFSPGSISVLATALRCNDAVKFAKYLPAAGESEDCLKKIKETLHLIEQKTENSKP
jgi:hypothetical protein